MNRADDILNSIAARKSAGEPFALATVVRTVAATAAKAGAKAVILGDGTISEGWIGGGCARAAVLKAARDALADGKSRLVSVQPPEELEGHGHKPDEEEGGVRFAKNMCPSQGTMDIFVEPVLPYPQVVICGSSPVAVAIADLARRNRVTSMFGFREWVEAGGLLSYGPSIAGMYQRAAEYVDRIAKGAKPTDLPIEQPTKFELVVNLKTANAIGIEISTSILLRADEVIE